VASSYNPHQKIGQYKIEKKNHRAIWFFLGFFLFFGGAVYALFFAGWFEIRSVKINASNKISISDVDKNVSDWLNSRFFGIERRANYYFLNPKKLSAILSSGLIAAKAVAIERAGHEIIINIDDRKPIGIWCLNIAGDCYFFDEKGIAYENTGPTQGFIFTTITDNRNRKINLGEAVESAKRLDRIFSVKNLLERNNFEVARFMIPANAPDEYDVEIFNNDSQKNWLLKLSAEADIDSQILAFADLYKKLTPQERSQLEYADLRVPDRIYYK